MRSPLWSVLLLLLTMPLAGQEVSVACEDRVLGTNFKTLLMLTEIGNEPIEDIRNAWDPWPNETWVEVPFGNTDENRQVILEGGDLFVEPVFGVKNSSPDQTHYRAVLWTDTRPPGPDPKFNLEGSAIYFRLLPVRNDETVDPWDNWDVEFEIYNFDGTFFNINFFIFGSSSGPQIYAESSDNDFNFWSYQTDYDEDLHHWFRFSHDAAYNQAVVETASKNCGQWTEFLRTGTLASGTDVTAVTMEFVFEFFFDENHPVLPGYIGALNQQPESRRLDLRTRILPIKILGTNPKVLDLFTGINEVSP